MKLANAFGILIYLVAFVVKEDEACIAPEHAEETVIENPTPEIIGVDKNETAETLTKMRLEAGLVAEVAKVEWSLELSEFATLRAYGSCETGLSGHYEFTGDKAREHGGFEVIHEETIDKTVGWRVKDVMQQWAFWYKNFYDKATKKCIEYDSDIPDLFFCMPYERMIGKTVSHVACAHADCCWKRVDDDRFICHFGSKPYGHDQKPRSHN